jgi:hypothetical protein
MSESLYTSMREEASEETRDAGRSPRRNTK